MTLLYVDGFAHGQVNRWIAAGNNVIQSSGMAQTASPRTTGGYYGLGNANNSDCKRAIPASAEVITGLGLYLPSLGRTVMAIWGDTAATQHLTLLVNGSGLLELRRGTSAGTLLATGTTVISANQWRYYEMRCTIADSGGICQVRLDGAVTNEIDYVGDTRNAGTLTTIDAVSLRGLTNARYADWYICNALGSTNSGFLGDVAVRTLVPTGDGATSQLVGSDGNSVSNWQQVDELPSSGTDYNGTATVGQKDTYAITDLPAGVTSVYGVQVAALMAKSDAGAASAKPVTRVSGTDYAPDTIVLTTSYVESLKTWDLDPAGAAWTPAKVNGMEIGMEAA